MRIKREIDKLVDKYKTNNPFELMDHLDIVTVIHPMHEEINGLYQKKFGVPIIYINSNLCDEEKAMVAAHELGHFILHPDTNIYNFYNGKYLIKSKFERQANMFAADLLLGDNVFMEYEGKSLEYIAACVGVSPELLEYKLFILSNKR